jgi:TolB-like protein
MPALVAVFLILLAAAQSARAQELASVQTLCVLDFQRLGDDGRADWLEPGLADLMIGALGSTSPYLVVERRHLKEILQEHRLSASGFVDPATAVTAAGLARAQLLLQGSFAREDDRLAIQVRLIRVSDQQILAETTWRGEYSDVLAAPEALVDALMSSAASRPLPRSTPTLERLFPTTIDEARSFYLGVRAFDEGRYPEALAHYLDAARAARDFRKVHPAVLEMYYLLDRSDHAMLYARDLGRSFEARRELTAAAEFYFAAAREAQGPVGDLRSARTLLEKALALVERHDRDTAEIASTRRAILARLDHLARSGRGDPQVQLSDPEIRHRVWIGDIDADLARRAERQARGGIAVLDAGRWVKRPVPQPTLLMWKIRTLLALARVTADLGDIRTALDRYVELLDEYEFLTSQLPADAGIRTSLETEAHFMMLRHYATTGQLVRDHRLNRVNKLNLVSNGLAFTRDFRDVAPDDRARVAFRYEGRGHEYFDFAAPAGQQIDSVTVRVAVRGIAELSLAVPQPSGRPPRFSLSRRLAGFRFSEPDAYARTVALPRGTEFVSLGTGWGPALLSNTPAEVLRWKSRPPADGRDITRWEITFSLSPKRTATPTRARETDRSIAPAVRNVIERYATGWDRPSVVRDAETTRYTGSPRLDVYLEDWLVYSLDGDIRIFNQRDLRLEVGLPTAVNTREREFDPSLIRTAEGGYALLWTRGTSRTTAARFVSFSSDLVHWATPQRLVFEVSRGPVRYTYAQSEPLERTFNIVALPRGYLMLLAQGFVRRSDDLRHWGPPRKELSHDHDRNRLIRGPDGTIWAVSENSSDERQPYGDADGLSGFFVVDGRRYRHVSELRVDRSADGVTWQSAGTLTVPGQAGALWAFAVDERRIGIGLAFNNLSTRWFTASPAGTLAEVDAELPFMQQSDEARFFVDDGVLTSVRPVFDPEKRKPMLLATSTGRVWGGSTR